MSSTWSREEDEGLGEVRLVFKVEFGFGFRFRWGMSERRCKIKKAADFGETES